MGQRRAEAFKAVVTKTWKRINGWKEKLLSIAGREVLIKAVLSAAPVYVMSCFRLPSETLQKLLSARNRYWWTGTNDQHEIHWVKNEHLERDKRVGGLDFRNLKSMNSALLAKQCWRLLTEPHLLMCRILKAKYFPDTSPLRVELKYRPSYVWRSIWSAKEVILAGLGNIEADEDYIWTRDDSLTYTTKSGYLVSQQIAGYFGEQSDDSRVKVFWNKIWKFQGPSKIKFFFWRLFYNCLPVATNLIKKGCDVVNKCRICGFRGEDTFHVFIECWWAKALWDNLDFSFREVWGSSRNTSDMLWDCGAVFNKDQFRMLCGITWLTWKNRNKVWHGGEIDEVQRASLRLRLLTRQWSSNDSLLEIDYNENLESWQPPKVGFLKLNCDGSLCCQAERIGMGVVARLFWLDRNCESGFQGW